MIEVIIKIRLRTFYCKRVARIDFSLHKDELSFKLYFKKTLVYCIFSSSSTFRFHLNMGRRKPTNVLKLSVIQKQFKQLFPYHTQIS